MYYNFEKYGWLNNYEVYNYWTSGNTGEHALNIGGFEYERL